MSFLQNILTNIEAHSALVTEAMSVAEAKIASSATAAEAAVQNDPLIGQIETAFGTLQTNVQAFITKHKL